MEHIKEPKGVDLLIESEPLTDEARQEISSFIEAYKAKAARKTPRSKTEQINPTGASLAQRNS